MKIYVKVVDRENQILTVHVKPEDTILEVKKKIAKVKRIPVIHQRLIHGGRHLMNESRVQDYHLCKESTIYLLTKLRYA